MQKLFAERFGLQVHEEKRKMAAFVLIVSKDGPKMTKTQTRRYRQAIVVPLGHDHREKRHDGGVSRGICKTKFSASRWWTRRDSTGGGTSR